MTTEEMALLIIAELRKQAPPSYVDIHVKPDETTLMLDGYFNIMKVAERVMLKVYNFVNDACFAEAERAGEGQ